MPFLSSTQWPQVAGSPLLYGVSLCLISSLLETGLTRCPLTVRPAWHVQPLGTDSSVPSSWPSAASRDPRPGAAGGLGEPGLGRPASLAPAGPSSGSLCVSHTGPACVTGGGPGPRGQRQGCRVRLEGTGTQARRSRPRTGVGTGGQVVQPPPPGLPDSLRTRSSLSTSVPTPRDAHPPGTRCGPRTSTPFSPHVGPRPPSPKASLPLPPRLLAPTPQAARQPSPPAVPSRVPLLRSLSVSPKAFPEIRTHARPAMLTPTHKPTATPCAHPPHTQPRTPCPPQSYLQRHLPLLAEVRLVADQHHQDLPRGELLLQLLQPLLSLAEGLLQTGTK